MESLSFSPGRAFLSVNSPAVPWTVVFEDEGVAGYFYACDRSQETQEAQHPGRHADLQRRRPRRRTRTEPERQRIASVEWSRDGLQAVLYLDGTAQALFDFAAARGYCRMDFPNFIGRTGDTWQKATHAWSDAALQRFEAALYA